MASANPPMCSEYWITPNSSAAPATARNSCHAARLVRSSPSRRHPSSTTSTSSIGQRRRDRHHAEVAEVEPVPRGEHVEAHRRARRPPTIVLVSGHRVQRHHFHTSSTRRGAAGSPAPRSAATRGSLTTLRGLDGPARRRDRCRTTKVPASQSPTRRWPGVNQALHNATGSSSTRPSTTQATTRTARTPGTGRGCRPAADHPDPEQRLAR